jgi:hypothetical protein
MVSLPPARNNSLSFLVLILLLNRQERRNMQNKLILAGIGAIAATAVIAPQLVSAYHGDPAVQGPNYTEERHQAVNAALENGDYQAWASLMDGKGATKRVNEGNFAQYREAHQLALSGDRSGLEEMGFYAQNGTGTRNGDGQATGNGQGYGKNR